MARPMAKTEKPASPIHAFDFLAETNVVLPHGVCVLFGGQRFLKLLCLKHIAGDLTPDEDDFSTTRFEGAVEWPVVMDELRSQSLFGSGRDKVVILDDADDFTKNHRERLEKVAEEANLVGTMVLVVNTWLGTTRLSKIVNKHGLAIHCDAPQVKRGKGTSVDTAKLHKWLIQFAKSQHHAVLVPDAAAVLCEFTENDFGRIDSELAKLSLFVSDKEPITQELVRQHVGGWRSQTMFQASDAIANGNVKESLLLIDRLLKSGEHPLGLFGQLSWSLRRYPKAIEVYDRMKKTTPRPNMQDVLQNAGFQAWGGQSAIAEANMRRLGRQRIEQLGKLLVEVDLSLKGSHSRDERARLAIEKLIFWLGTA